MILNKHKSFLVLIVVGLGLILLFGLACPRKDRDNPLDPGAENYVVYETNAVLIFDENFESYGGGTPGPPKWYSANQGVILDCMPLFGLNNSYGLEGSGGADETRYHTLFNKNNPLPDHFSVEFYIKLKGTDITGYIASFRLTSASNGTVYAEVGIDNDGAFFYNDGQNSFPQASASLNIWYLIKIIVNTKNKTMTAMYKQKDAPVFEVMVSSVNLPLIALAIPIFEIQVDCRAVLPNRHQIFDNLKIHRLDVTETMPNK